MADQAVSPPDIFELTSRPGIKRDGTDLDNPYWQDGQWIRFQRGRIKKMGGYEAISQQIVGPARAVHVDSRGGLNRAHVFTEWGVEQVTFDLNGTPSGSVFDRTPAGFTHNSLYTWQAASMFQGGGVGAPYLIAAATPDLAAIDSDTAGPVYSGDITGTGTLTAVSDGSPITVSGGCVVLQPVLFVYGSNGLIRNSNANDISTATGWTTGGSNLANEANVAATKIIKGLPIRGGGQSPAGLFWALDALIRVSFVGGTQLWQYDTLSDDTTIMSKNGVVEYDNVYFWMGTDRFYMFNGIVQELPNQMNINWVFDNLNISQRQKVWALKVPRYGEIWWHFPYGSDTECSAVAIFNVREGTWYDTRIMRSAGFPAKVFSEPVMSGDPLTTTAFTYTPTGGAFIVGESIQGLTSGATGKVARATGAAINLTNVTGAFINGENISDITHGGIDTGTITSISFTQQLDTLYHHEHGYDKVVGATVSAIQAYGQSSNIQWVTGGPLADGGTSQGANFQLRLCRVEPDFILIGSLSLTVKGKSYAQGSNRDSDPFTIEADTEKVDLREQRRELSVKIESNEAGGFFEMGKVLITAEPGDERG